MRRHSCRMHTVPHRLPHSGEAVTSQLLRFARALMRGFAAFFATMAASKAERVGAADDILWDDGEPEDTADRS